MKHPARYLTWSIQMSGSSEGRGLHEGSEPAAVGDSMAGKAGTSRRRDTVPQLPSKGDRVGLVSEPRGRRGPGMAGQACGDHVGGCPGQ